MGWLSISNRVMIVQIPSQPCMYLLYLLCALFIEQAKKSIIAQEKRKQALIKMYSIQPSKKEKNKLRKMLVNNKKK